MERLFSYGTLRQPDVQADLFGRSVPTIGDSLAGFRLETVRITDSDVIAMSGSDVHPILRRATREDIVTGAFLELSAAELAVADDYEVDDYVRVAVRLASGVDAWVYVASADA